MKVCKVRQVTSTVARLCAGTVPIYIDQLNMVFNVERTTRPSHYSISWADISSDYTAFLDALRRVGDNRLVITSGGNPEYEMTLLKIQNSFEFVDLAVNESRTPGLLALGVIHRAAAKLKSIYGVELIIDKHLRGSVKIRVDKPEFTIKNNGSLLITPHINMGKFTSISVGHFEIEAKSPDGFTDDILAKALHYCFTSMY